MARDGTIFFSYLFWGDGEEKSEFSMLGRKKHENRPRYVTVGQTATRYGGVKTKKINDGSLSQARHHPF
jgi:hypothetical protein